MWYPPAGSVDLWGEDSEEGQWFLPTFLSRRKLSTSPGLDARHFSSFLYATGAFQAATLVLDSEGVGLIKSVLGFFKRNGLGLQQLFPPTQSPLVFAATSCGDLCS